MNRKSIIVCETTIIDFLFVLLNHLFLFQDQNLLKIKHVMLVFVYHVQANLYIFCQDWIYKLILPVRDLS
uniref:Uncharacterized protein n=1 Tax=Clostridium botulinum TaxID=1491 RepID=R4NP33_CLOBO|nr:conserved hypothetical protein [Clostridium botulinum]AGL45045.1 conserved hypothetical protein [Clostridium botulinum]AGL45085.1 conserved hypothetical protein [Clostridium botulinum]AGL45125.1 conserved hypothetical protein [Clostridium botulinum]AGL45165.1 conserved hypothetical protein [Clostridium botulinum]